MKDPDAIAEAIIQSVKDHLKSIEDKTNIELGKKFFEEIQPLSPENQDISYAWLGAAIKQQMENSRC